MDWGIVGRVVELEKGSEGELGLECKINFLKKDMEKRTINMAIESSWESSHGYVTTNKINGTLL